MRGLDYIRAMRRKGFKPACVNLTNLPYDRELLPAWPQYEPVDAPETEDLRALFGMFVVVMGTDADLVDRWCKAAMSAGASTVIAMTYEADNPENFQYRDYRLYGSDQ
jgi:hypothetical protein